MTGGERPVIGGEAEPAEIISAVGEQQLRAGAAEHNLEQIDRDPRGGDRDQQKGGDERGLAHPVGPGPQPRQQTAPAQRDKRGAENDADTASRNREAGSPRRVASIRNESAGTGRAGGRSTRSPISRRALPRRSMPSAAPAATNTARRRPDAQFRHLMRRPGRRATPPGWRAGRVRRSPRRAASSSRRRSARHSTTSDRKCAPAAIRAIPTSIPNPSAVPIASRRRLPAGSRKAKLTSGKGERGMARDKSAVAPRTALPAAAPG